MSVCRLARDPNGKRLFAFGCPHTYIVNGRRNGPRNEEAGGPGAAVKAPKTM